MAQDLVPKDLRDQTITAFRNEFGTGREGQGSAGHGTAATFERQPVASWDMYDPVTPPPTQIARPPVTGGLPYQDQMRARQQALIDRLHGIASGQVKSPAQELFEQQIQQAQNQNVGTSASLRDVGPGGQAQIAAQNRGMIQGQGKEQGAILQKQQKQQAEFALAQLYEQQRQGDMGAAAGASDEILGNRQLDDSRYSADILRMLGVDIADTERAGEQARTDLGFDTDVQASNAKTVKMVGEKLGTTFDYLRKAGGGAEQAAAPMASLEEMNKPGYGWGGPGA